MEEHTVKELILDIVIVMAAVAVLYLAIRMFLIDPYQIQIKEIELGYPNLPPAFDGYTILHLSDLHIRKLGKIERMTMDLLRQREVDTCFITGDVTAEPRASDTFRRVCSTIRHRDPIYMVLGNSEHKPWVDTATLVEALSFEGLKILVNSNTAITYNGSDIQVVGVDDPFSRLADLDAAFAGVDPQRFVVLLAHCPSAAPAGFDKGADLVLSGHTHGGQVRIPGIKWYWTHMRSNKMLNDGLYTSEDLKRILGRDIGWRALFVNRGVGSSRIFVRFSCPPEIVYITLRRTSK